MIAYTTQVLLAFTITGIFLAIMLFLMVCLPTYVTGPYWERCEDREDVGSSLTLCPSVNDDDKEDYEPLV